MEIIPLLKLISTGSGPVVLGIGIKIAHDAYKRWLKVADLNEKLATAQLADISQETRFREELLQVTRESKDKIEELKHFLRAGAA